MTNWIGRTLSKVEIQRRLGRGGMAEVYLGYHTSLNRPVAVKFLHGFLADDEEQFARFRAEAQAVAGLRHAHIIQVFDFDVFEDQPYMVLELVEGSLTLEDYLQQLRTAGQRLPPEVAVRLLTGLAAALDYAHARGIVHRDVKPANILLRRESGALDPRAPLPLEAEAILTDFGVARLANSGLRTAAGGITGTPAYLSPEQARGDPVDGRSDLYSLGVVLYEMLAGRLPFEGDSDSGIAMIIKHLTEAPPPVPGLNPALQAVLDKALAKERDQRYQRAEELMAGLLAAIFGAPPSQTAPGRLGGLLDTLNWLVTQAHGYQRALPANNYPAQAAVKTLADLARQALNEAHDLARALEPAPSAPHPFSPRELEVLGLAAGGLTNKEIAYRLGLSERTVQFHLNSVFNKTGASSRTEAVSLALKSGWL